MKPIRILLADDHVLVRAGIRSLLQNLQDVEVIGEADDGNQALQMIQKFKPDVVLMDIAMPGLSGLEATERAVKEWPGVRIVMLSMHADQEYVRRALRAGAAGYLLKGARTAELEVAVSAVARGETYLSPAASKHLIGDFMSHGTKTDPYERLTSRQREILQLIGEGYTRKQISQKLGISSKTFDTFRAQLMDHLDLHDNASLVRYAIENDRRQRNSDPHQPPKA